MNPVIAIVGPTATGKTAVGVRVAEALGGEVISADSVAVYRGLDVGAAKPDAEERSRVPFHLLDVAEPDEAFHVSRFKALADAALHEISARDRRALLVGGTGLYVRAFLDDFGLTQTSADSALRQRLNEEAERLGVPALHARLNKVDPVSAGRIHENDRVRIVRALEVFEQTGVPISEHQARDAAARAPKPAVRFGLTAAREELNRRIDERVDRMMADGLLEEVEGLVRSGVPPESQSMRSLGYREMAAHLAGETDLAAAVAAVKQNTRRFAKRQWTWFKTDPEIRWLDVTGRGAGEVAGEVLEILSRLSAGP